MYYSSALLNYICFIFSWCFFMTYKHNLSKGKGGKVITGLEWRTALAEILCSSFRLSKISSLISRRILIQNYSSELKRGQVLILSGQKRTNVPPQKCLQFLHGTWEAQCFPFTFLCERFSKVLNHNVGKRRPSVLSKFLNCHFFSRWALHFWVAISGLFFSPPAKENPFLPLPQEKSFFSTFHCTLKFSKLFISWFVQKKILFNLIVPK